MKIFLDTNIIMDYLLRENRPNYNVSMRVLYAARCNPDIIAYTSVQSLTDAAFFFTKKSMTSSEWFLQPVKDLLSYVRLRNISEQDAYNAMSGNFSDFEDDLQLQCAIDAECVYFITGDQKILQNQPYKLITAIHPADFLARAARQAE